MHFPDFEREEIESRQRRARELMAEEGLDALLLTTEKNYRYLSGHWTQFWVSNTRPMFMVFPLSGDPTLLVAGAELGVAKSTTWVEDVRTWVGWASEGVQALADILREKGLTGGRIGAELGKEQRLGMPHSNFIGLQKDLPGTQFVDAADLLWTMRARKSSAEIARHRKATEIADRAFQETFGGLKVGMTEADIYAGVGSRMVAYGADDVGYVPLTSGEGNYERVTGGPTQRAIRKGDLVWIDNCCPHRGYWADFCRFVAVGSATQVQKDYYKLIYDVLHKCIGAIRPGDPISNIMNTCNKEFAKHGEEQSRVGRMGHGVGLDLTEPPSLTIDAVGIMEPGMVFAVEPNILNEHGYFQLEEDVVITETGCEVLSNPAPPDLWIL